MQSIMSLWNLYYSRTSFNRFLLLVYCQSSPATTPYCNFSYKHSLACPHFNLGHLLPPPPQRQVLNQCQRQIQSGQMQEQFIVLYTCHLCFNEGLIYVPLVAHKCRRCVFMLQYFECSPIVAWLAVLCGLVNIILYNVVCSAWYCLFFSCISY